MLRELKIRNLALIESLHLVLNPVKKGASLTVLTGETGAGKSIILQALNLLSACKAPKTWIRSGAESASVEAFFEVPPDRKTLLSLLEEKGFDVEDILILKRIISSKGRSRYFINDSMATAALVESVCENLFSVASQHEHQILLNPRNHLDIIDSVGELWPRRNKFSELFVQWSELQAEQKKLELQEQDREQRRDLLTFQLKEITDSNTHAGEDEELVAEKKLLKATDSILELGRMSYQGLSDNIVPALGEMRKNLEQMAQYDESIQEITDRITSSGYEIDDLARQINQYLHDVQADPARLEEVEERIDLLQKLKRKYGGSQSELPRVLEYAEEAEQELSELDTMDQRLAETGKKLAAMEKKLTDSAEKLSAARLKTAARLEKTISAELKSLSFTTADFRVDFGSVERDLRNLAPSGWDRVEFMFSANPGEPVKPLATIASGGELSRLLLGLKCILAGRDEVATVIFDEVDAGIGGQAAEDISVKIKQLSGHHQVLCITHLPAIASKADEHFRVTKSTRNKRTATDIALLEGDNRIDELARMLAGDSVTAETLAFARRLLKKK